MRGRIILQSLILIPLLTACGESWKQNCPPKESLPYQAPQNIIQAFQGRTGPEDGARLEAIYGTSNPVGILKKLTADGFKCRNTNDRDLYMLKKMSKPDLVEVCEINWPLHKSRSKFAIFSQDCFWFFHSLKVFISPAEIKILNRVE